MSVVSTMILTCSVLEGRPPEDRNTALEKVNNWVRARGGGIFQDLAPHFGGGKYAQMYVYGGAFHTALVSEEEFLPVVRDAGWLYPQYVQLFISGEHDWDFAAYRPCVSDQPEIAAHEDG